MNQTILQRVKFWLALKLLGLSTDAEVVDTYSLNAPFMRTSTHRPKSTRTTGLSSVTLVVKEVDSISQKHSPNLDGKIVGVLPGIAITGVNQVAVHDLNEKSKQ